MKWTIILIIIGALIITGVVLYDRGATMLRTSNQTLVEPLLKPEIIFNEFPQLADKQENQSYHGYEVINWNGNILKTPMEATCYIGLTSRQCYQEFQIERANGNNLSVLANWTAPQWSSSRFYFNTSEPNILKFLNLSILDVRFYTSTTYSVANETWQENLFDEEGNEYWENYSMPMKVYSGWTERNAVQIRNMLNREEIFVDPVQSACGTISTAGEYGLNQSISSVRGCINITANNVIFNGNGSMINYTTSGIVGYAFNIQGVNGTIIKNTVITEGSTTGSGKYAIYVLRGVNNTIINNSIRMIDSNAIRTSGNTYNLTITKNFLNTTIGGSDGGLVYLIGQAGKTNYIWDNDIYSITSGTGQSLIEWATSGLIDVRYNTIYSSSSGVAYAIDYGPNSILIGNNITMYGSGSYGIYSSGGINLTMQYNRIFTNQSVAFMIEGNESLFDNSIDTTNLAEGMPILYNYSLVNTVIGGLNRQYGLVVCGNCTNVTYEGVNLSYDGISIFNSTGVVVENSNINTTNGHPVFIHQGTGNTIRNTSIEKKVKTKKKERGINPSILKI